jgi:hypothetical protein
MLDIGIFFPDHDTPAIHSLSNSYEQLLTSTRTPSDIYYFNSLINAITKLEASTLAEE